MAYVEYTIAPNGETYTVKTVGIEGTSCSNEIQKIIQRIGGSIKDEERTDDWYKSPKANIFNGASN